MKYNIKIKIIFGVPAIAFGIIGVYGLWLSLENMALNSLIFTTVLSVIFANVGIGKLETEPSPLTDSDSRGKK